jgi:hypothetical protein
VGRCLVKLSKLGEGEFKMRLRKLALLVLLGVTTVSSWCGAFEYVSKDGGFKVAIPDRYSLFVTKDAVVAVDSASGSHSFIARELQKDGKVFTTPEFQVLLQAMGKELKAGKDVLHEPAYAFLSQAQKALGAETGGGHVRGREIYLSDHEGGPVFRRWLTRMPRRLTIRSSCRNLLPRNSRSRAKSNNRESSLALTVKRCS